ncbi:hypothetical protein [Streptomyces sp. NPDC007369]|uniref:hypothetical protein n=1 Tax=Streptomyces sp. NPDC007369 TaxID=3154589 RepID=UPI0033F7DB75
MTITRHTAARALRALLGLADRLHPIALLVLVLALAGLAQTVSPLLVDLLTGLVDVVRSAALLGGAAMLARLAIRVAAQFHGTTSKPPAPAPSPAL